MTGAPCPDFETRRLAVQEWTASLASVPAHAALSRELSAILTPPVLRHLPEAVQLEPPLSDPIGAWMDQRQQNGTIYTLRRRSDDRLVGLLTLAEPDPLDLRLGYLLGEFAWGQGLASEAIAGFVAALPRRPNRMISGGVVPENVASARVLLNAGFERDDAASGNGIDVYTRAG